MPPPKSKSTSSISRVARRSAIRFSSAGAVGSVTCCGRGQSSPSSSSAAVLPLPGSSETNARRGVEYHTISLLVSAAAAWAAHRTITSSAATEGGTQKRARKSRASSSTAAPSRSGVNVRGTGSGSGCAPGAASWPSLRSMSSVVMVLSPLARCFLTAPRMGCAASPAGSRAPCQRSGDAGAPRTCRCCRIRAR